jgi:hypothetical protein
MEIELAQLKVIVDRLLDHAINSRGVSKITVDKIYYWAVPEESRYNMEDKPSELEVGSLDDDWDFIKSLSNKQTDPVIYQLTEVAPLLSYLGETLSKEFAKDGG